jgi:uncharacterized iron-regulated membrane protein
LRRAIYLIHLYLGLSLGLVTVVLGLTGSLLVFRHEIDAALSPSLILVEPGRARLGPAELVSRVEAAYPDDQIKTLNVPSDSRHAVEFWMKRDAIKVYVDPYSGKVLGDRKDDRSLMGWIFKVHTELFSGHTGETVAGVSGLALVMLAATGLIVWWPRKRQKIVAGLKVKFGAGAKRTTYDLHRAVGFWACALLSLIGATGAALVFPDQAKAISYLVFAGQGAPGKPNSTQGTSKPVADLIASALTAMPEGEISRLMFPAKAGEPFIIRKRTPNEIHPNGMNYVFVDPVTAKVLRVDRDNGENPALSAMNLRYPLHIGLYAGNVSRVLHALVGLTPSLLAVTGVLVWWNRRFGKRKKLRRAASISPSDPAFESAA